MRKSCAKHVNALTISRPCFWSQDFRAFSVWSPSKYLEERMLVAGRKAELIFNILKWGVGGGALRGSHAIVQGFRSKFGGCGCATAVLAAVAVRQRSKKNTAIKRITNYLGAAIAQSASPCVKFFERANGELGLSSLTGGL
jgi:hypothetical protein